MSEKSLAELIDEAIASGDMALPVFPRAINELRNALKDERKSLDTIAKQIAMDASLASQVLRVANSSFYAGLSKINTVKEAIVRLGLGRVVQIATLVMQKGLFSSKDPATNQFIIKLWQHSVAVALGSEWLAKRLNFESLAEEAFLAGLFHDIGELLLLKCLEDMRVKNPTINLPENLVREVMVRQHEEKGAWLLQSWNLPEAYGSIAGSHHHPLTEETGTVELMVRVADMVSYKLGIALRPQPELIVSNSEEVSRLGLSDVTLAELEIALEDTLTLSS
ncbi:HDOD domain-containing protein [Methylomicrobium sp. RS1]|jgi:putative nucleotidyltransferase with HDIG domain|uniref:HDOD domain-containing protein n=1 Tax=Candidatus Methylomicrobium oryzae TaxID=2802053 RepID=UPI00192470B5|nr:HDOD domain-containing protein [Methylomicrobium sp. RS1]MBL1265677.1 HDOD domain-containing protein [Methylomicrobium sp. RS1]